MFQKSIFVGRIGKDSVQRYMPNGDPVTSFSLAVDNGYGENKSTIWLNVSAFGKLSETVKDMKKGKLVLVEGRLTCDPATGGPRIFKRSDGSYGASFEINAENVRFLSGREEGETEQPIEAELPF